LRFPRLVSIQVRNKVGALFSPSDQLTFAIGNPAPIITTVEGVPQQIIAGYPGFTVTLTGSGFNQGGTVEFAGVARPYVLDSSSKVRAFISPADLAVGRIAVLTATNPSPTIGPSNEIKVTVFNPVAGLTKITPALTEIKVEPNSTGITLALDGFLFKPGAIVKVGGVAALNSNYVSSIAMTADIPP